MSLKLFALFSFLFLSEGGICPYRDLILPCTCKESALGPVVICSKINVLKDLLLAFQFMKGQADSQFFEIAFEDIRLGPLPKDLFVSLDVLGINFVNSDLQFEGKAFEGLENSLQNLLIGTVKKSDLENLSFSHLVNLKRLDLQSVQVNNLSSSWSRRWPKSLERFKIYQGSVKYLGEGAFSNLSNLHYFTLIKTEIVNITNNILPGSSKLLTNLDLSSNNISHIDSGFFENMTNLEEINLNRNKITSLDERTWKPVWKDSIKIRLYTNQILCDDSLEWILKLENGQCSRNKFVECHNLRYNIQEFLKNLAKKKNIPYNCRST